MDEMFFPMHMNGCGGGDVLLTERSNSGLLLTKNPSIEPCSGAIQHSLIEFSGGGTGFILATHRNLKIGSFYILGLAITAAHVVCNRKTYKPTNECFTVTLENDFNGCKAYFIKSYLEDYPQPLVSKAMGFEYFLPGDIALLLLYSDHQIDLNYYPISQDINLNESCFVSGYPKRPENLIYCCPQLDTDDDYSTKIIEAFHGFNKLVYAEGKVKSCSNLIVDIECSTTNGMSGSPIVINSKFIGVYVGGPPLPGQRFLQTLIEYTNRDQFEMISSISPDSLLNFDSNYTMPIFTGLFQSKNLKNLISHKASN